MRVRARGNLVRDSLAHLQFVELIVGHCRMMEEYVSAGRRDESKPAIGDDFRSYQQPSPRLHSYPLEHDALPQAGRTPRTGRRHPEIIRLFVPMCWFDRQPHRKHGNIAPPLPQWRAPCPLGDRRRITNHGRPLRRVETLVPQGDFDHIGGFSPLSGTTLALLVHKARIQP